MLLTRNAVRTPDLSVAAQRIVVGLVVVYLAWWVSKLGLPFGVGGDYGLYMGVGHRLLEGGPLYTPEQLAGPHVTLVGDAMYPPSTMPLVLAFAVMPELPSRVLWYGIPIAVTAWCMWRLRPTGWPAVIALCLFAAPSSAAAIYLGNPVIWATMAVALGTIYRWPAVFALLKPSYFVFALPGLRDRRGWLVLALFAVVSLITLPLTLDWIRVILNARGEYSGLGYSLSNVPLLLAPWVATLHLDRSDEARHMRAATASARAGRARAGADVGADAVGVGGG